MKEKHWFVNKWLFLAILWWLAGAYALIWRESSPMSAPPFPHFDKMAHFFLFFAQTWLLAKIWLSARRTLPIVPLLGFALCNAVASEWAQAVFTVSRQADVWDGVADMIGAAAALYVAVCIQNIRTKRNARQS